MKIAFLHNQYDLHTGVSRYIMNLALALIDKGHEVHIFTSRLPIVLPNNKIQFHKVPAYGMNLGLSDLIFSINVKKKIRKYQFDIIHTFGLAGFGDIIRTSGGTHRGYAEFAKKRYSPVEKIYHKLRRFLSIHNHVIAYLEKKDFLFDESKCIYTHSNFVAHQIYEFYNIPKGKISIIVNGVDINLFNPQNKQLYRNEIRQKFGYNPEHIVLLFVGSNFERKGLKYLLYALKNLPQYLKLLIVGKGKLKTYENMCKKLSISNRVKFLGIVRNVEKYYACSDIFVLPTTYDAFSNSVLEAMATGLPVITTSNNGASEIIQDGYDGYIVDPFSIEQIVDRIDQLLANNSYKVTGERARKKAEQYDMETHFQKVFQVYSKISC